jgi:hypothetical protein
MNRIIWFFLPYKKKLKRALEIAYENKQGLHLLGFVLDFEKMKIEKNENRKGGEREMNETLKPCPFCGGTGAVMGKHGVYIMCVNHKCMARTGQYAKLIFAIKAWNRRVNENPIDENRILSGDEYEKMVKEKHNDAHN